MNNAWKSWNIRQATSHDLSSVLGLFDEAITWLNARDITRQWGTTPVSARPHLIEEISQFLDYGIVAEREEIEGFIAVSFTIPDDFASYLGKEAVAEGAYIHTVVARRVSAARGAGAALLRWAEQYTKEQGKTSLYLSCWAGNPDLMAYYERMDYIQCGEVHTGETHTWLFKKQLAIPLKE